MPTYSLCISMLVKEEKDKEQAGLGPTQIRVARSSGWWGFIFEEVDGEDEDERIHYDLEVISTIFFFFPHGGLGSTLQMTKYLEYFTFCPFSKCYKVEQL